MLKDIATKESLPNLTSLIAKRKLEMPLTSFKLQLSNEATSQVYNKIFKQNQTKSVNKAQPRNIYEHLSFS